MSTRPNLKKLIGDAMRAERKARYLGSPTGLAKSTYHGLPRAAKKVFSFPFAGVAKFIKRQRQIDSAQRNKWNKPTPEYKRQQKEQRGESLHNLYGK